MIIFNTVSQATDYVKKHSYSFNEGCGCCFHGTMFLFKKNLVIENNYGESKGYPYNNYKVIGRIKNWRKNRSNAVL